MLSCFAVVVPRYDQSLEVLRVAKGSKAGLVTKSSIMLGLGEKDDEVLQTMKDLRDAGVDILTFGQYLQVRRCERTLGSIGSS